MPRKISSALAALALGASLAVAPLSAVAASQTDLVSVRVVNDTQGAVVLVRGQLASSTKLPAQVTLTIPSGAQIAWAGEILGGDPAKDPQVKYERSKSEGYDVITMTLTKARTGQVEYRDPSAVKTQGQQTNAEVTWVSPVDAASGQVLIEVPQNAQVSDSGGALLDTSAGNFYKRQFKGVKAGDTLSLKIAYTASAAGNQGNQNTGAGSGQAPAPQTPGQAPVQTGGTSGPASPMTLVLVALLLVGGTLFALRYVNSKQE